jgi:hypothetical protein
VSAGIRCISGRSTSRRQPLVMLAKDEVRQLDRELVWTTGRHVILKKLSLTCPRKIPHPDVAAATCKEQTLRTLRSTEAQIVGMIKEQEAGLPTVDVPQAWVELGDVLHTAGWKCRMYGPTCPLGNRTPAQVRRAFEAERDHHARHACAGAGHIVFNRWTRVMIKGLTGVGSELLNLLHLLDLAGFS